LYTRMFKYFSKGLLGGSVASSHMSRLTASGLFQKEMLTYSVVLLLSLSKMELLHSHSGFSLYSFTATEQLPHCVMWGREWFSLEGIGLWTEGLPVHFPRSDQKIRSVDWY